jgi:transcriptional regulator with XRE-family HTH domain
MKRKERKERKIPPLTSRALDVLRTREGWNQKELAAATGIPANLISDYEQGRKTLTPERLDFLLTSMGVKPAAGMRDAMRFLKSEEIREPDPPGPESRQIEAIAADSGRLTEDFTRSLMRLLTSQGQALEARQQARSLWEGLKRRDPEQRRVLVEKVAKLRNWALSELLCEESIKAAGDSADRALELANLALRVAERIPGDEAWRQRVQGYAWAHVGNARRVKGDLPSADEAFGRFQKLWSAGAVGDSGLLNEARVLGLEASLRRAQRRFEESLRLIDRALGLDRNHEARYLLLNKAGVLNELEDYEGAVVTLREAIPLVERDNEPRILFALRFNLGVNLCFSGKHQEAEELMPQIRRLAASADNSIDLIRLRWLEGRILAGLGRRREAVATLSRVREELATQGMSYDMALASLELATLYLEEQRTFEVQVLARQISPVFKAQGIHREALAALKLFREVAERQALNLDFARRLTAYLHRARNNPDLAFESAMENEGC